MTYIVEAWVQTERDVDFLPDGRIPLIKNTQSTLSAAVKAADRLIEKMKDPSTVVEVREKKGLAKYRVQRDQNGTIQKVPLV